MKTIFLYKTGLHLSIGAALLLASACTEEPAAPPQQKNILKEFKAPAISLGTKSATLPDAGKMVWEKGDRIVVGNGSSTAIFTYNASRDVFITESDDFCTADSYKAIFPDSALSPDSTPGSPLPDIPSRMKLYPGYLKNLPLTGTADKDAEFVFTTIYAPLRIDFPVDRLPEGNSGKLSRVLFLAPGIDISYDCINDVNVSQPIYIAIPAGEYPEGFKVEMSFEDSSTCTLVCSKYVTIEPDVVNLSDLTRSYSDFSGGEGTEENPYIINSTGDFIELLDKCSLNPEYLSKHYRQESDINMEGTWAFKPIASAELPFTGSYDGTGHSIEGCVWSTPSGGGATGLFRYAAGAEISNLILEEWNLSSKAQFLGGFAGKAYGCTFRNCHFKGVLKQSAKAPMEDFEYVTVNDNADFGFCGGIAGYAEGCTFEDCTLSGSASAAGKALGGIAGYARNCMIKTCSLSAGSELCSMNSCAGGIAGAMTYKTDLGGDSVIDDCSVSGSITATSHCGGIAGYVQKGDIRNCAVSGSSSICGSQINIGGIAGCMIPKAAETCTIDRCTAYCDISGQYSIGGISGFIDGNNSTGRIYITNSSFLKGTLSATGTDGNQYALAGGISGWIQNSCEVIIENCLSAPAMIKTSIQNASEANLKECKGGVGGLIGVSTNNVGENILSNCFTTVSADSFRHRYKFPSAFPAYTLWGAVIGKCMKLTCSGMNYCCPDNSLKALPDGQAGKDCIQGIELRSATDGTLAGLLNEALGSLKLGTLVAMSRWTTYENGYPRLECTLNDPSPRNRAPKRVSIIGDSISSFNGYIPSGYSWHYPCADGSVTRVEQTWWHQLIYKKMSDAILDVNMSYAGSAVANSDEAASGTRKDAWCNNSYVQRYIRLGGIGQPDIVLIHGGTNDWAHSDFCPLYPGSADCRNAEAPPAGILKTIFDTADAADNREEIESLAHNDFCSAYIKLLCLIRNQYPDAKIVCIIGDYLSEGIEKSIIAIADHYGAKYIDLLAVNGFNDQVYMPKHDYNGSTGCHPNAKAMTFIADKIYGELGVWMEE